MAVRKKRKRNRKQTGLNLFLICLLLAGALTLALLFLSRQKVSLMVQSREAMRRVEETLASAGFPPESAIVSIEQENYDEEKPYLYVYRRFQASSPAGWLKKEFERAFSSPVFSSRIRVKTFSEEKTVSSVLTICRIGTARHTFYKVEFLYEIPAKEQIISGEEPPEERRMPEASDAPVSGKAKPPVRGRVAIIIDDMGSEPDRLTKKFLTFPEKLTFAVFPFSEAAVRKAEAARQVGRFDIMLHQPMEAQGARERGIRFMEGTIQTNMSEAEIFRVLTESFKSVRYARGLNNHQGSLATSHPRTMAAVMKFLKARGYYFVDSYTTAESVGYRFAAEARVPWLKRDIFLDNEDEERVVQLQLNRLIQLALKNGSAVGIGHTTRDATITVLLANVERMRSLGIEFVHVRELLNK